MDFLLRVHVKAEEGTDPRWIKRELVRHLAGNPRARDGFAVSSADGFFDVTHANGSGVWAVANAALDWIQGWVESDFNAGTDQHHRYMADIDALRARPGPKPL